MSDFLTRITAPTLGSATFATDLREVFQNIDDNFKKIVSAPYLEGQEGNSVESYDMPILEDGELTDFGKEMMRTILGDESISTIQDIIDNPDYNSVGPAQHTVYECIVSNPTMKVLRVVDPDTNELERWICSAEYYYFVDMRLEDLGNCEYPSTQTRFIDYSCLVFAEWDGNNWSFTKGNMVPTLYYSSEQSCFCWKVNGMETGIRAQGVKGDAGRPPKAAVVSGRGSVSGTGINPIVRIVVDKYSVFQTHIGGDGEILTETTWGDIQDSGLQDGDLVVCIFNITDTTYNVTYPDMIIANIKITGEGTSALYTITSADSNRMSSLWRSYILFYAFRDIDYKSVDQVKTKALFIPAASNGIAHAIFQDDSGVNYSRVNGRWSSVDTKGDDDLVFKKVREKILVGSQSVGNENRMSSSSQTVGAKSKVKFTGYDMEVEGNSKATVSGASNILLGVPVGSIVNWLDMERIPDGWYVTGETTDQANPVFGMREVDLLSNDYDVEIKNGDATLKKLVFTGISSNGDLGERDTKFMPVFCTLTGNELGIPVVISTECQTYENYKQTEKFGWNWFDTREVSAGILFYLTKYIG